MTTVPTTPVPAAAVAATAPPPDNDPVAHTQAFMDALLAHAPADHHGLLWTLQDKRSTWVPMRHGSSGGPDCPTEVARTLSDAGRDVYVAVSLAAKPGLHDTRITSANSAGIFGLWADIDIADPDVHKKWNLPPTIDDALSLLDAVQLDPTLVVHSGHGLQAWWLFNDFWTFSGENDRLEAAGLAQRWNTTLQVRAAERQWVVDSTFDLARVMRVPGTLNRKGDPVMPVRLLRVGGPRYRTDDFDRFVVDGSYLASRGITPGRSYKPDEFDVTESNRVDDERLEALIDNDDQFKATYDMKRKDFTDQSPSSYDLSLASLAARAGWTDREIGALILRFRRRHKLDTAKALRTDYIYRTISRARDGLARDEATEALEEVGEELVAAKQSGDDEAIRDARRRALDSLGQQLGIEILHIIKYLSEPASYALVTPTKTITLGGNDGILSWAKLKASVWEGVGESIPRFKTAEWDRITDLVPKAWEEQDVGAEATERGEIAAWLAAYVAQRPPVDTVEEAVASEYPFLDKDGRVVLFGQAWRRWLYLTYQERVSNVQIGRRLRAFGCEPDKINVDENGRRTSRSVWRLPANVEA